MKFTVDEKIIMTNADQLLHQKKLWSHTLLVRGGEVSPSEIFRPFNLFMRDEQGEAMAGACGFSNLGNFLIDVLWVDESCRRQGLGLRLYSALEDLARKRGCSQLIGAMYDFHGSRAFFEKVGGTCFATLKNPITGHEIYYVHKMISETSPV